MLTTQPRKDLNLAIRALLETTQHIDHALTEIYANQPGYPAGTGTGAAPQLTDAGTPAGLEKHLRPDPARDAYTRILEIITHLKTTSTELHHIITIWTAEATTEAQPRNTPGDCITCGTTTTKPDRLRAGLCGSCYRSWARARAHQPGIERHTWITQRRHQLAGDMVTTSDPNNHR